LLNSCSSAATVEATGDYVGGIFGRIGDGYCQNVEFDSDDYTFSLYQCINTGSVKGKDYVGGIGGYFGLSSWSEIKNKVVILQSANEGDLEGVNNVGGIWGAGFSLVNLCYSIGDYSASGNNLGGIVGYSDGGGVNCSVTNCYSMANLTVGANGYAGGIYGNKGSYMGEAIIENCYYAGNNSTNCGLIGYSGGNVNITNCLTTLSSFGDTTTKSIDWEGDGIIDEYFYTNVDSNSLNSVTSILQNKSIINNDNAYSDVIWANYNYDCVKFAAGLTGNVTAPGFGTEIIY
jgi:hypothetical protein